MCNKVKHDTAQGEVAYLDIGAGGYLDLGSELPLEQLMELPKGRHALAIIGTYGIDGYVAAAPGIDHLHSVMNALSRNISDAYEKACQNGDERMQTIQNARQSLLNTIREALPQSDGSEEVTDA